jgi:MFS family permease
MKTVGALPLPVPMRGRIFYGWIIAAASACGIACGIAVFLPATIGLLVRPLGAEFGWSPASIFAAITVVAGCTVLIAPFIGRIIDYCGPSRVLVVSFLAEAILVASFRYINSNILFFYARYAALAILATGTTSVAFSALLCRWFERRRGLALGIALAGVGLGGFFWSLITHYLFSLVGWRVAFTYLAVIIALIMAPMALFVLRDSPESMGLHIDGNASTRTAPAPLTGLPFRQIFSDWTFWLIAVTFFMVAIVVYGVMLNLVPLLESQGQSGKIAAEVQGFQWLVIILGRVFTGFLIDRFFAPRVAIAFLIPPVIGIAMLAHGVTGPSVFTAAMLVGLAVGAEGDMLAYMTSRYFGLKNFGVIYALYFSLYAVGTGVGPTLIALAAGPLHHYSGALWSFCGILFVAAALLASFRRFPTLAPQRA